MTSTPFALCFVLAAAAPFAAARSANSPSSEPNFAEAASPARLAPPAQRLLVDQDEAGTIWVRGNDYKLSLDAKGAKFRVRKVARQSASALALGTLEASVAGIPIALASDVAPQLHGNGARFERGAIAELWEFSAAGARQNFLLPERLAAGDLVLQIPLLGELRAAEAAQEGAGLSFRRGGEALVNYGEWLAFDQRGHTLRGSPTVVGDSIEIRLPADYLAAAEYPLLIDPLVSSASLFSSTHELASPEVALDESLAVLLVAYTDTFAAGDPDIVARRYTEAGQFLGESPIDISDAVSTGPAVGNHEALDQFLVAWHEFSDDPYTVIDRIRGRTIKAGNASMGASFLINLGDFCHNLDVGGTSSSSLTAPYYVVWQQMTYGAVFFGQREDIAGRTVSPSGETGNKVVLDGRSSHQGPPRVSKRTGPGNRWMVVYATTVSDPTTRIDAAFVHGSGVVLQKEVPLPLQSQFAAPDVDGDGTDFLTVCEWKQADGQRDILGIRSTYASSLTHSVTNLSLLEMGTGPFLSNDQRTPTVARTKNGFTYAYLDAPSPQSAASASLFCASVSGVNSGLPPFLEKRVSLSNNTGLFEVSMCNGLLDKRSFITWLEPGQADSIGLAVYDSP